MEPLVLHEYARSGNCYKIRLTAAHAGVSLDRREYDIMQGETRTPEFLAQVNANGRIPVLQVGERFLPESNAACWYLATGTSLIPEDPFEQADALRWLFWEQYNHEPNVATLRFWFGWIGEANFSEFQRIALPLKRAAGLDALRLMDNHLAQHDFLVGGRFSVADICLYAYTHTCEEGGYRLADYPAVEDWLKRVEAQPGHVTLD
ncbi:glutathione S-transferase family protein [Altererythrobacter sp. Root672]|uniref:glutathione S-transferase family protein n=1 Tax=Altererythrobacter sp. Root672 TaxID=1736584 RepID=UPI0006F9CA6C|nr:glutathione S-transferase family protein [Altererythrobacter sp. Root672]KRA81523.1 glutathione S-transferase [Altererythrobacter sp. Root672]